MVVTHLSGDTQTVISYQLLDFGQMAELCRKIGTKY